MLNDIFLSLSKDLIAFNVDFFYFIDLRARFEKWFRYYKKTF